jgi:hypothetical protein
MSEVAVQLVMLPSSSGLGCRTSHFHSLPDYWPRFLECCGRWWSRFSVRPSPDLDLFITPSPSANPSSLFLFWPEDIDVLLVLIPSPVNRAALFLDPPVRLLVLEYTRLDSALPST